MRTRFSPFAVFPAICVTAVAYAQEKGAPGAQTPPGFAETLFSMVPMFVIVFFIFYFLVLKPQEKKARDHQTLLESLKKGDEVVTTSGFLGRVAGIEKDYILVELANNVRVKLLKSFVSNRVEKEEKKAESKERKRA